MVDSWFMLNQENFEELFFSTIPTNAYEMKYVFP